MYEYRISLARHKEPPKVTYVVTLEEEDDDLANMIGVELSKKHDRITKIILRKRRV